MSALRTCLPLSSHLTVLTAVVSLGEMNSCKLQPPGPSPVSFFRRFLGYSCTFPFHTSFAISLPYFMKIFLGPFLWSVGWFGAGLGILTKSSFLKQERCLSVNTWPDHDSSSDLLTRWFASIHIFVMLNSLPFSSCSSFFSSRVQDEFEGRGGELTSSQAPPGGQWANAHDPWRWGLEFL